MLTDEDLDAIEGQFGKCALRSSVNGELTSYCRRCGAVVWDEDTHSEVCRDR